jgi:hypothetical protein
MKRFLNLILFLSLNFSQAQISEKSVDELESLFNKSLPENTTFELYSNQFFSSDSCLVFIRDSLNVKFVDSSDFDNNGEIDIMAFGQYSELEMSVIMIALNFDSTYSIRKIYLGDGIFSSPTSLPIIDTIDSINVIKLVSKVSRVFEPNTISPSGKTEYSIINSKFLTYKFGTFIEYNPTPTQYQINRVEYSTDMCYGECPVFDLTIIRDSTWFYSAKKFNKKKGRFKTKPDLEQFSKLEEILNYSDFENLDSSYSVNWTDEQTAKMKIVYENNKSVMIKDYGLQGTYGLIEIYNLLFDIKENMKWKRKIKLGTTSNKTH